jgi:hypothetical protein
LTAPPVNLRSKASEEVVRVLMELSVVEQRYEAVMKVLRDEAGGQRGRPALWVTARAFMPGSAVITRE